MDYQIDILNFKSYFLLLIGSMRYFFVDIFINYTIMCNNVLTIDIEDRIRKFNMAAYYVLLKTSDLNEAISCEFIVKKCVPLLLYGIGGVSITNSDMYKLHIAYRKIYRYIFKMSLRASISDLFKRI